MIVVTTPTVPGYKIVKVIAPVFGLSIRTRGALGKIMAGIEGFLGGEIESFRKECEKARIQSLRRMVEQAETMGANAIVGVDFETSNILESATIFSSYGTAVIVEKI